MKLISIFISTLLFLCLSINAQEKEKAKCPEKESKEYVEKEKTEKEHKDFTQKDELFKNLNLSDKQKQDLDELFKTHRENIKNIMTQLKEKNAPKEEYQETFKNARTDFDSKLAQILTDEQLTKFKEAKEEYYKKREQREQKEQKELKEQAKPKRMSFEEKLNLSNEQKEQYKKISEKYVLLQKELKDKMMGEIKGILTEEQVKKLEEMKEHPKAEKSEKSEKSERGEKGEKSERGEKGEKGEKKW
jgi:Spy/CpxP family protein refolding chaperone